jgi:hypothetical protein
MRIVWIHVTISYVLVAALATAAAGHLLPEAVLMARFLGVGPIVWIVLLAWCASCSLCWADPPAGPSPPANSPAGWGSISGRVLFEGELTAGQVRSYREDLREYEPQTIEASRRGVVPRELGRVRNRRLIVDLATGGLENVFVYLRKGPAAIHPAANDLSERPLEVVFRDREFWPRNLIVRVGQTVRLRTEKEVADFGLHFLRNVEHHPLVSVEKPYDWIATEREPLPAKVTSNLHRIAVSYWLVVDHPYAALTAADGSFRIANLPPGKHELVVWHETIGYLVRSLAVDVTADEDRRLAPIYLTPSRLR